VVKIENQISTVLIHDALVGVKWKCMRVAFQPTFDFGGGVGAGVVKYDVQWPARVAARELVEKREELSMGVLGVAGAGDLPGRDLQSGVDAGRDVALVVVGDSVRLARVYGNTRLTGIGSTGSIATTGLTGSTGLTATTGVTGSTGAAGVTGSSDNTPATRHEKPGVDQRPAGSGAVSVRGCRG
jgi:hypothetical protein